MPEILTETMSSEPRFEDISLHIVGAGGKLGKDLGELALSQGLFLTDEAEDAEFIALCTPSYVAEPLIEANAYPGKTIIDLSGAAKRSGRGQYGLMQTETKPWNEQLDVSGNLYGNPGCIASAVILGLGAAGLSRSFLPERISVVSVGGKSHAPNIEDGNIKLARRMGEHPHINEIVNAFDRKMKVTSFMPVIADVPAGLLVNISGQTSIFANTNNGVQNLSVEDVIGTNLLHHRLECYKDFRSRNGNANFSLAIALDNVRFVTTNVINLLKYIKISRKART